MALQLVKQNKAFGGWVKQFRHASVSTKTDMTFSVFLPPVSIRDIRSQILIFKTKAM